jgi:hypothetical protein
MVGNPTCVNRAIGAGVNSVNCTIQVLPTRERVKVLLEILGMEREVEVETSRVILIIRNPLA